MAAVTFTKAKSNSWNSSNGYSLVRLRVGGYHAVNVYTYNSVWFMTKPEAMAWIAKQPNA